MAGRLPEHRCPQPDLVPLALAIEERQGVAVGHANDTPLEGCRNSTPTGEGEQQGNRKVLQENPSSGLMHSGPSTEPRLIAGLTGWAAIRSGSQGCIKLRSPSISGLSGSSQVSN